jgi:hypothetical protein
MQGQEQGKKAHDGTKCSSLRGRMLNPPGFLCFLLPQGFPRFQLPAGCFRAFMRPFSFSMPSCGFSVFPCLHAAFQFSVSSCGLSVFPCRDFNLNLPRTGHASPSAIPILLRMATLVGGGGIVEPSRSFLCSGDVVTVCGLLPHS